MISPTSAAIPNSETSPEDGFLRRETLFFLFFLSLASLSHVGLPVSKAQTERHLCRHRHSASYSSRKSHPSQSGTARKSFQFP